MSTQNEIGSDICQTDITILVEHQNNRSIPKVHAWKISYTYAHVWESGMEKQIRRKDRHIKRHVRSSTIY